MKEKKILYLTSGSYIGGADRSLIELLKNLDKSKLIPIVLIPSKGPMYNNLNLDGKELNLLQPIIKNLGIKVLNIECVSIGMSIPGFIRTIIKIVKVIYKYKIDLIHSNDYLPNQYGVIVGLITKTPIISHVRLILNKKGIFNTFLRFSTQLIAISNATALPLYNAGINRKKINVVYNGLDLDRFKASKEKYNLFRKKYNIENKVYLIGIFSRICKEKGQDIAIQALYEAKKTTNNIQLLVVGSTFVDDSDKYYNELIKMIDELNLTKDVIFTGFINDPVNAYNGIDAMIMPSETPSFGRTLIEAMAMGKPTIGPNHYAPPEIIKDGITGFLIKPKNVISLADAIVRLASNNNLSNQMGIEGRLDMEQRFSSKIMTQSITKTYREILR